MKGILRMPDCNYPQVIEDVHGQSFEKSWSFGPNCETFVLRFEPYFTDEEKDTIHYGLAGIRRMGKMIQLCKCGSGPRHPDHFPYCANPTGNAHEFDPAQPEPEPRCGCGAKGKDDHRAEYAGTHFDAEQNQLKPHPFHGPFVFKRVENEGDNYFEVWEETNLIFSSIWEHRAKWVFDALNEAWNRRAL